MFFTYKHLQKEAKYQLGMFIGYLFKVFRCKKLINFETRQNTIVLFIVSRLTPQERLRINYYSCCLHACSENNARRRRWHDSFFKRRMTARIAVYIYIFSMYVPARAFLV